VCMLCRQAQADPEICGYLVIRRGFCAHVFCLCFANNIAAEPVQEGALGFHYEDIQRGIEEAAQKNCCVCRQSGAAITCQETGCECSFHLPCATKGGCIAQYFVPFRAFCREHRPQQVVEATPEKDTTCLVCMDPVDKQLSYITMVCPVCRHAWFHRECIQGQALHAGISAFQCPLCRNRGKFLREMLTLGIHVPRRPPAWEETHAVLPLLQRHSRCDASECLCPRGRQWAEEDG
ncbi:G2/M phase-specific E3 ubiquitin-protein ligase, partial [Merops nubicus]